MVSMNERVVNIRDSSDMITARKKWIAQQIMHQLSLNAAILDQILARTEFEADHELVSRFGLINEQLNHWINNNIIGIIIKVYCFQEGCDKN